MIVLLYRFLIEFRKRIGIIGSILFTSDGFIITLDQGALENDSDKHQSLGAVCAGIASLAGNGVEIIDENNKINQICVQAGNQLEHEGFQILIESVADDILLAMKFPISANYGVIQFELKQIVSKLKGYFISISKDKALEILKT
jgi:predicted regulator of Ras-like GTPase activity (Roadblock/LC7/MglB family)